MSSQLTSQLTRFAVPVSDCASARDLFNALLEDAQAAGASLRPPPPEPTSCCGRGCNGCVWEGFYSAANDWREEALQALLLLQD